MGFNLRIVFAKLAQYRLFSPPSAASRLWIFPFLWSLCGCSSHTPKATLKPSVWPEDLKAPPKSANQIPQGTFGGLQAPTTPVFLDVKTSFQIGPQESLGPKLLRICQAHQIPLAMDDFSAEKTGITYEALNQPLSHIIRTLCEMYGLSWSVHNNSLCLRRETPYLKVHEIHFLVGHRQIQNTMTLWNDGTTDLKLQTPRLSGAQLSAEGTIDFWAELDQTLKIIMTPEEDLQESPSIDPYGTQKKFTDPSLLPLSFEEPALEGGTRMRLLSRPPQKNPSLEKPMASQKPEPLKKMSEPLKNPHQGTRPYGIHKQAGLLSVYGNQKQHTHIADYLKRLKKHVGQQVMIEAKIVEILLNDGYKSGVDWRLVSQHFNGRAPFMPTSGDLITIGGHVGSLSSAMAFMERFGEIRTLSNPRIRVLNNQPAVLKVAKNEVFFSLEVDRVISAHNKPDIESVASHMHTVPIGLIMMVQPSVDPDSQEITLTLRPTLSRVMELRDDPAVSLRSNDTIHSYVPVVQTREMDSVIRVKSKDMVVLGGLMEDHQTKNRSGLLLPETFSFLDAFFSQKEESSTLSELVIFLKVWIEEA